MTLSAWRLSSANGGRVSGSKYDVRRSLLVMMLCWPMAYAGELAEVTQEHSDIDVSVSLDAGEQSGKAVASVRIHAPRDRVWSLITSCPENVKMLPGLQACEVIESAPDHSWQLIRHVMNYSWYVPTLTYEMRALYDRPRRVSIERVSGDLRHLSGSWNLSDQGEWTEARYDVEITPGFWVPHWLVRAALRRDLPKMLRALRASAEASGTH